MKILVIGGTRFFGKRLVENLLQKNHQVTILTRGMTPDSFQNRVERIIADRTQLASMQSALKQHHFDIILDQMCMTAEEAQISIQVFQNKIQHYVMTSTLSVYGSGYQMKETEVDPVKYQKKVAETRGEIYAEGKRAAEHALTLHSQLPGSFSVAFARIPVVLAENDYTQRLLWHVQRIQNQNEIYFPNLNSRFCFIHADEAAAAIEWLGLKNKKGIYNFSSTGDLSLHQLVQWIEGKVGKNAILTNIETSENRSPFGVTSDWTMNIDKSISEGFKNKTLVDWLPLLIDHYIKN